jgi:hypothetical protein
MATVSWLGALGRGEDVPEIFPFQCPVVFMGFWALFWASGLIIHCRLPEHLWLPFALKSTANSLVLEFYMYVFFYGFAISQ